MKKLNEMLAVLLVSLVAVLVAAVGLRIYNTYVVDKQSKQEQRMQREEVLARNREANDRVLEMRQEIQELSEDRERLKVFLEELQAAPTEEVIPVSNMMEEDSGMSGRFSDSEMMSLSKNMTGMSMNTIGLSENDILAMEKILNGIENTTGMSWNMTNISDDMTNMSENEWSESGNSTASGSSAGLGNRLSRSGSRTVSDNRLSESGNNAVSGNRSGRSGSGAASGNRLSESGNSTMSGNGLSESGNSTMSGNGLSESGNSTMSGNGLSESGNSTMSGNGLSESGNSTVSGNGLSISGNTSDLLPGLIVPEISLEARRAIRSSYEETLLVNEEDIACLAERQIDFSGKKIACLGDSITAAANLEGQIDYPDCSYPSVLQELLGAKEVCNLGVGGSTIGRYWADPFVERYREIPRDTDIIIVMGGTNDGFCLSGKELGTLEERKPWTFCGDLDELMRGLRKDYPRAEIYFVTPLPNILQDYLMRERAYLLPQRNLVGVILTLAAEYDFKVIDLYNSNLLDSHDADIVADYMPDGVHANAAGYRILAQHIAAELLRQKDGLTDSLQ